MTDFLDSIEMTPIDHEDSFGANDVYATHEGVFQVLDFSIKCYQLNTGQRVLDADDVAKLFLNGD